MKELSIGEIRDMSTKEIQRTINDLRKNQVAGKWASTGNTGAISTGVYPQELSQIKKSIARCKTVLNERRPER